MPHLTIKNNREDIFEQKKNERAVIYARFSSDAQSETSIEQQVKICTDYIEKKEYTLIKIYQDSALSAQYSKNRPQFLQMISDAKKGLFDVCVSITLDRVSREGDEEYKIHKQDLKSAGARFEYVSQYISNDMGGKIYETLLADKAKTDIDVLRFHVNRGMAQNAEAGFYNGGKFLPVGFEKYSVGHIGKGRRNKYRIRPMEEKKKYIIRAFEDYANGKSTKDIADFLNEKGLRNTSGGLLNRDSVLRMISNPVYRGTLTFDFDNSERKETYILDGGCEAILSDELWHKVQAVRESRRYKGAEKTARVVYELKNKIFCGECNSPMVADSGKNKVGIRYYYYACRNNKRPKDAPKCHKQRIEKNTIEAIVIELINNWVWSDENINLYYEASKAAEKKKGPNPEILSLQKEIRHLKNMKDRAMDEFAESGDPDWKDKIKLYREALEKNQTELDALMRMEADNVEPDTFYEQLKVLSDCWSEMQSTPDGRKKIIEAFVHKVYVYDPEPDDPDKLKIKVIIRTDLDSEMADEVEAEINLGVRHQLPKLHQMLDIRTFL